MTLKLKFTNKMKVEEYINKNRFQNEYDGYNITEDDALQAVEMARKEEREKSLSCFEAVMVEASFRNSNGEIIDIDELKNQFSNLINNK